MKNIIFILVISGFISMFFQCTKAENPSKEQKIQQQDQGQQGQDPKKDDEKIPEPEETM